MDRKIEETPGYEEKFVVFNLKHIATLPTVLVEKVSDYVQEIVEYMPTHKYLVCNQDEPYAQDVLNIILGNQEPPPELLNALRDIRSLNDKCLDGDEDSISEQIEAVLEKTLSKYQYIEEPCPECKGERLIGHSCEDSGMYTLNTCPHCKDGKDGKVGRWVKG